MQASPFLFLAVGYRWLQLLSVAGEDQGGDDWTVVAHFNRDDLRLNGVPCPFGLGEDIVNFLAGGFGAECEIICRAVKPLVHELPNHWVIG